MAYKSMIELQDDRLSSYNWLILILVTLTGASSSIQSSGMPVLFKEISDDLGLSLVEIGTIWGISHLAGIFVSIIAGILSDRLGIKLFLTALCLLVGITGAFRGLSNSFIILTITVFANGMMRLMVPINLTKLVGTMFKGQKLGMAMGMSTMGMGLGMTLGPLVSATILSPWLGGWRNVMFFYGAISILFGILCFVIVRKPSGNPATTSSATSLKRSLIEVTKLKVVWLLGLTMLFRVGGFMGMIGYLPLYLRGELWTPAAADGALTLFFAAGTLFAVPMTLLSDKLGLRKVILLPVLLLTVISTAFIPVVPNNLVWALMILTGGFFDGAMAIAITMLLESNGLSTEHSGIAVGIFYAITFIGGVFSPPIGNSFAEASAGMPFFFWAGLATAAFLIFLFVKETGWKKKMPG